jgi:carboxypeptidase C (cathepsin A)
MGVDGVYALFGYNASLSTRGAPVKSSATLFLAALGTLVLTASLSAIPPEKSDGKAEEPKETATETQHHITLDGKRLDYVARAGTLNLQNDEGKVTASMFYVAYTLAGESDLDRRPITFAFNGGPGSSAVWLHLGLLGPKRVELPADGVATTPPYRLVDNEATLLDASDLVFIDPVSTGFSRAAPGQDAKVFHSVQGDIQSVGQFIRRYISRFGRWNSPKYLAGESYGTTRASGLVAHLQDSQGINCNGVVLVSAILNFETALFDAGNDLPYILFLPSYTAAAWYHRRLAPPLQADLRQSLAEAARFAEGEYATALMKGSRLTQEESKTIAGKLARYTGLSETYIDRSNLRVEIHRFAKELLRDQRLSIGRFDSRLTGPDLDAVGDRPDYDPSYEAVYAAYTAALNQYLRTELKYQTELTYEILTGKVHPWDVGEAKNRYLNVAESLRGALTKNAGLRVYIANGYYDLATPFMATEYTVAHLGLPPTAARRIKMSYFEGGHMMYTSAGPRHQLKNDLKEFVEARGIP